MIRVPRSRVLLFRFITLTFLVHIRMFSGCIELLFTFSVSHLLHWIRTAACCHFHVDNFLFWNKIPWRNHANYLLERHKKFNFVTSRGQFTGKTWHKIFLKQFLADFKIIRDSIIMITVSPMCQMFIKKVKKQRARKFDRISWNSNHQSPCEINCDLSFIHIHI